MQTEICDNKCDSNIDVLSVPDESFLFEFIFWRRIRIKLLMIPVGFTWSERQERQEARQQGWVPEHTLNT